MIYIMQTALSSLLSELHGQPGNIRRFELSQWGDRGSNEEVIAQLFATVLQQSEQTIGGIATGHIRPDSPHESHRISVISSVTDSVTDHSQHQKIASAVTGLPGRQAGQGAQAINLNPRFAGPASGQPSFGVIPDFPKQFEGIGSIVRQQAGGQQPDTSAVDAKPEVRLTGEIADKILKSQRAGVFPGLFTTHTNGDDVKSKNPITMQFGVKDNVLTSMPLQSGTTKQPAMQQAVQDAATLEGIARTKTKDSTEIGETLFRQLGMNSKPDAGGKNGSNEIQNAVIARAPRPAASGDHASSDPGNSGNNRGSALQEATVLHVSNSTTGEKPLFTQVLQQTQQVAHVKNPAAIIPEITLENPAGKPAAMLELPRTALNDIIRAISMRHNQDSSEIKFKLKPEHLGELVIRIRMEGGKMIAQAEVAHASVKAALEHQLPQLRDMLASKGIDLQRFDVYSEKHSGSEDEKNGRWSQHTEERNKRESQIENIEAYRSKRLLGYNTIELVF
jgi:hypothetical protein